MGSKGSTSTQSVSIPPEILARYNAVNERAENVAQTPFTPYSSDAEAFVAPLTSTQQAGIANINAIQGMATPDVQGGQGLQMQGINTAVTGQNQANAIDQAALQGISQAQQQGTAYNQAAGRNIFNAMGSAAPYMNQMGQLTNQGLGQGQQYLSGATDLTRQAISTGQQYADQAQPYYTGALQAAQPFNQQAQAYMGAGAQNIGPQGLDLQSYLSPQYQQNVINPTVALLNQQQGRQRAEMQGRAIQSGAFGGDRAGIEQANLAQQQALAMGQTVGGLNQANYQQALAAAQQQQGVGLSAAQANRAAQQQAAQQAASFGQQQYGQQLGLGQALSQLGQQQYGQALGTGAQINQLGQAGYQQNLGAGAQLGQLGQNLYSQNIGQGQAIQGLGNQQFTQGLQGSQAAAGIGQNIFGNAAQTAGIQQAGGMNIANLGLQNQAAQLGAAQGQMAAGQQQQQTNQAGKTALYNQFLQQQGYPFQIAQFLANIAEGTGALSGSTTTASRTGQRGGRMGDGYAAGGLVPPDSQGGAVYSPGAYYRGGYDDGGPVAPALDANGNNLNADVQNLSGLDPAIAKMYTDILGRSPDSSGAKYWQDSLKAGMNLDQIKYNIQNSREALLRAGDTNLLKGDSLVYNSANNQPMSAPIRNQYGAYSARDFAPGGQYMPIAGVDPRISNLYNNKFGRAPDVAGGRYWTDALNSGRPISQIENSFNQSQEYQNPNWGYGMPQQGYGNMSAMQGGGGYGNSYGGGYSGGLAGNYGMPNFGNSAQYGGAPDYAGAMQYGGMQSQYGMPQGYGMPPQMGGYNQYAQQAPQATGRGAAPSQQQAQYYNAPGWGGRGINPDLTNYQQQASGNGPSAGGGYGGGKTYGLQPNETGFPLNRDAQDMAERQQKGGYGQQPVRETGFPPNLDAQDMAERQQKGGYGGYNGDTAQQTPQVPQVQAPTGPQTSTGKGPQAPTGPQTSTGKGPQAPTGPQTSTGKGASSMNRGGRAAFADGGSIPGDPYGLSQNAAAMYAALASGKGGLNIPAGGQGQRQMLQPQRSILPEQRSGVKEAIGMGTSIASLGEAGTKLYDKMTTKPGTTESASTLKEGLGNAGTKIQNFFGFGDKAANLGGLNPEVASFDPSMLEGFDPSMLAGFAANGGRIGRNAGGRTGLMAGGIPGLDDLKKGQEEIPGDQGLETPMSHVIATGYQSPQQLKSEMNQMSGGAGGAGGAGGGSSALGTAASIAGLGMTAYTVGSKIASFLPFLLSDRRAKSNIEPIGKTFDGQTIHRYNYKGDPRTQIGLIAQEVEKKHPKAVGLAGGMKTVNYDTATRVAADRGHFAAGGNVGAPNITPNAPRFRAMQNSFNNLVKRYHNNPLLAAAAMDVGTASVDSAIRKADQTGRDVTDFLPRKTQEYMYALSQAAIGFHSAKTKQKGYAAGGRTGYALEGKVDEKPAGLSPVPSQTMTMGDVDGTLPPEPTVQVAELKNPDILRALRGVENAKGDPTAKNPNSTAGGLFQYLDNTWQKQAPLAGVDIKQYPTARSAPEEIQNQVADANVSNILAQNNGKVQAVPHIWYSGNLEGKLSPEGLAANKGFTQEQYNQRFFRKLGSDASEGKPVQVASTAPVITATGLAPPKTDKSSPWADSIGKILPDAVPTDSSFWVPLIAGLGSMLASNQYRFSQRLGDGLVGGAAAYGKQQEFGLKKEELQDKNLMQRFNLAKDLFKGPTLVNGIWKWEDVNTGEMIDQNEYMRRRNSFVGGKPATASVASAPTSSTTQTQNASLAPVVVEANKPEPKQPTVIDNAIRIAKEREAAGATPSVSTAAVTPGSAPVTPPKNEPKSAIETSEQAQQTVLEMQNQARANKALWKNTPDHLSPLVLDPQIAVLDKKITNLESAAELANERNPAQAQNFLAQAARYRTERDDKRATAEKSVGAATILQQKFAERLAGLQAELAVAPAQEKIKLQAEIAKLRSTGPIITVEAINRLRQEKAVGTEFETVEVMRPDGSTVYMPKSKVLAGDRPVTPGAGSPTGGAANNTTPDNIKSLPASTLKMREDIGKDELKMSDDYAKRQVAQSRVNGLLDIMTQYETGKFADTKGDIIGKLRGIGINVPDTASANPAKFEIFMKGAIKNVFDDLPGGKILLAEISGLSKANANSTMQPEANAKILGDALAATKYEDKYVLDYAKWRQENPNAYSPMDTIRFNEQWLKANNLDAYKKETARHIGYIGQRLPTNLNEAVHGQRYFLPKTKDLRYFNKNVENSDGTKGGWVKSDPLIGSAAQ